MFPIVKIEGPNESKKIKIENVNCHSEYFANTFPIKKEPYLCKNEELEEAVIKEELKTDEIPLSTIKTDLNNWSNEENFEKNSRTNNVFHCTQCLYETNQKGSLKQHMINRHTAFEQIKWFQCTQCPYKGKTKNHLRSHLVNVHEIKWHECRQCPFKSKTKLCLDRHLVSKHTSFKEINWFECPQCSYKAKLQNNLKQHIVYKHTKDFEWYKCEYCAFKSKTKGNLKLHVNNMHTANEAIKWFECEQCAFKAKQKVNLKKHVVKKHPEFQFVEIGGKVFASN